MPGAAFILPLTVASIGHGLSCFNFLWATTEPSGPSQLCNEAAALAALEEARAANASCEVSRQASMIAMSMKVETLIHQRDDFMHERDTLRRELQWRRETRVAVETVFPAVLINTRNESTLFASRVGCMLQYLGVLLCMATSLAFALLNVFQRRSLQRLHAALGNVAVRNLRQRACARALGMWRSNTKVCRTFPLVEVQQEPRMDVHRATSPLSSFVQVGGKEDQDVRVVYVELLREQEQRAERAEQECKELMAQLHQSIRYRIADCQDNFKLGEEVPPLRNLRPTWSSLISTRSTSFSRMFSSHRGFCDTTSALPSPEAVENVVQAEISTPTEDARLVAAPAAGPRLAFRRVHPSEGSRAISPLARV